MKRLVGFIPAAALAFPGVASADSPGTFDKLFPHLAPLVVTDEQSRDIAGSMLEGAAKAQPDNNTTFVQGQFLDHDTTNDPAPPGTLSQDNARTANLDLDSVYGDGPQGTPALYEPDGEHFRIGVSPGGFPDLPRRPDGIAVIADGRNDENLVIAQFHLAFLLTHNQFIDAGLTFEEAQARLQHDWQSLVLNEYLPRFVGDVPRVKEYNPGNKQDPVLPKEFSQACFRFGHSQVRGAYALNTSGGGRSVFAAGTLADLLADNPPTLVGGRPIPANARIEWTRFFNVGGIVSASFNAGRQIDTDMAAGLFALPIGSVVAGGGSNVLAFRNIERGSDNGLGSYEDVAQALGITPINVRATIPDYPATAPAETPLWFGMLAESEAGGGLKLGPTCGRIVNEVFRTNVERDKTSFLNTAFTPEVRTTGDFLARAGVVGGPF